MDDQLPTQDDYQPENSLNIQLPSLDDTLPLPDD
jgi:hypothetical protein